MANSFDYWKDGSPIVEPSGDGSFDEWKDGSPLTEPQITETTTFFETDFTEASPLDDWTSIWATSGFTTTVATSSQTAQVGSKNLYVARSVSDARSAIVWDGASGPGTVTDAEVLCLVNIDDNIYNYSSPFRIHVRAGGSAGSEEGYHLEIRGASTDTLSLYKYIAGVGTALTNGSVEIGTYNNSSQFWIRFRVIGTSFKVKVWFAERIEPKEWVIDCTDSSISSGTVGLGTHTWGAHYYCEYFAVDTSGGTVPVPDLTSGTLLYRLTTNAMIVSSTSLINYARAMGFPVPDSLDGYYIKQIGFYAVDWFDNIRFAVYVNSDATDPTNGATLVEDLGVLTATDSAYNYYDLTESYQVSSGDVVWIAVKGNDTTSKLMYSSLKGDAMGQLCNGTGRFNFATGIDFDETVAWPSDISGATGSASDYWYSSSVTFQDGPLDATTTTTTTISTTTTTTDGGGPPEPGTGNENTVIVIATI